MRISPGVFLGKPDDYTSVPKELQESEHEAMNAVYAGDESNALLAAADALGASTISPPRRTWSKELFMKPSKSSPDCRCNWRKDSLMDQLAIVDKLRTLVGKPIGLSDWFLVDQKRINQFAECTEDNQWIHTDVDKATDGPYGRTIAHGFLILSFIPAMSKWSKLPFDYSELEMKLNYGMDRVRFLKPVPVDSRVRSRMELIRVKQKGPGRLLLTTRFTIEMDGENEPACVADVTGLYILK